MMVFGVRTMNFLGYRFGVIVASFAALYFFLTSRTTRRASREYLTRLYEVSGGTTPTPSRLHSLRHHWTFAITVVDRLRFWQGKLHQFQFAHEGTEHMLDCDRGAVLFGAHVGSFDAMRAISRKREVPLTVVMHRENARRFNAVLEEFGGDVSIDVVEIGDGVLTGLALKQRVDRNELVALLADRVLPGRQERTIVVPFLGKPASFPVGPWLLASLLGCEVLFSTAVRVGPRHYSISVTSLFEDVLLPRNDRTAALRHHVLAYARRLEAVCLAHPYQWFNFFDFWEPEGVLAEAASSGHEAAATPADQVR